MGVGHEYMAVRPCLPVRGCDVACYCCCNFYLEQHLALVGHWPEWFWAMIILQLVMKWWKQEKWYQGMMISKWNSPICKHFLLSHQWWKQENRLGLCLVGVTNWPLVAVGAFAQFPGYDRYLGGSANGDTPIAGLFRMNNLSINGW